MLAAATCAAVFFMSCERKQDKAKPPTKEPLVIERDESTLGTRSGDLPACVRYRLYHEAIQRCDKLPREARAALGQGYEAMTAGWRHIDALPPEARHAMENGCRQGYESLAQVAAGVECSLELAERDPDDTRTVRVEADPNLPRECNEYRHMIYKLSQCDKMPKQSVDALQEGLRAIEQAWTNVGSMPPEAKKAMADGCRQGTDALKQAASAMCGW